MAIDDASNFTYQGYGNLIGTLLEAGYDFASFAEAESRLERGARFVLMRHDIDMCLARALRMAELEASLGVSATYFLMVTTEHYNVFSAQASAQVSRVLQLGHRLGLHFDCAAYPLVTTAEGLAQRCGREAEVLGSWFGSPIEIVSFHRPDPLVLSGTPAVSAPLPHTYSQFFARALHYCSDSQGRWRYGTPLEQSAFREGKSMQILVHPIWWNDRQHTPLDTLHRFLRQRKVSLERSLAENCLVFPPPVADKEVA